MARRWSVDLIMAGKYEEITAIAAQCLAWVRQARGEAVFTGVEHVGLYPTSGASGADIAAWYEKTFGFKSVEGNSSFFLSGGGAGRIEVMKHEPDRPCHLAVRVSDFEAAVAALQAKGVALGEPSIKPTVREST
jgi:hypothetical protein